jgi:hypothetical protein
MSYNPTSFSSESLGQVRDLLNLESEYDFARCQRADGTVYGTGGQCRKGTPTHAKPSDLESKIKEAYQRETRLRASGDLEGAKAAMREHMRLVRELDKKSTSKPKPKTLTPTQKEKTKPKLTHEIHADLQRGFTKKAFEEHVTKWGGEISGETDRGVVVRFPDDSSARNFARGVQFDSRIKGVRTDENDVNSID